MVKVQSLTQELPHAAGAAKGKKKKTTWIYTDKAVKTGIKKMKLRKMRITVRIENGEKDATSVIVT